MTVKEYCEKKVQELKAAGCKEIKVEMVDEVTLGPGNRFSYMLFTAPKIPETAELIGDWSPSNTTECKGAQVRVQLIKPRCRKPVREYFYAVLA